MGADQRTHQLEERLEQVDVDHLADAGVHGDHRGERGDEAGDLVGERDRRQQRPAVGLAVDRRRSPLIASAIVANPGRPAYGPVLSEPGDAGDDELRVARQQVVGLRARVVRACRAGSSRSARRPRRTAGASASRSSADFRSRAIVALAATDELPPQGDVVAGVAPAHAAHGVAAIGPLDLDDVGAEVGEVAGARRARRRPTSTSITRRSASGPCASASLIRRRCSPRGG